MSSNSTSSNGLVVLISGCSSGFGQSLAQEALRAGLRVIATARNVEALVDLEKAGAAVLQLDVTASEAELDKVATKAIAL